MTEPDKPLVPAFWYRVWPELRYFKSREEMREAKKAFRHDGPYRRRTWITTILIAVGAGAFSSVVSRWLVSLGLSWVQASLVNMVLCGIAGAAMFLLLWRRPYTRFVRRYLQDRGVAVCLKCGYDLRGQIEPRCPECGQAFDARLLTQDQASAQ